MQRVLSITLAGIVALVGVAGAGMLASAESPANDHFQHTWSRTDQPVAEDQADRTWMWGPEAFTGAMTEPYAGSPNGERTVQYFNKSRMEITHPESGDPSSIWYVTNGLLVVELITGEMQVGDDTFETRAPAAINVAGDAGDPDGPTYATFGSVLEAEPLPVDTLITQRIDRDGNVTDDPGLTDHDVTAGYLDEVTNHSIAAPFWEFMNSSGTVWDGEQYTEGLLFENPFFATGRPITEAYWANVAEAGTDKDVLIQCFERRCLTYTPDNPKGWQVEAGNVGQHYYAWRYEQDAGAIAFTSVRDGDAEIYSMGEDGSNPQQLTDNDAFDIDPVWSPDGDQIVFTSDRDGEGATPSNAPNWPAVEIYVMDADGSNQRRLTNNDAADVAPEWSPDGDSIVFTSERGDNPEVFVMDADGGNQRPLTDNPAIDGDPAWSPDGERIVFESNRNGAFELFAMGADGGNPQQLTDTDGRNIAPAWSPDGSRIAFTSDRDGDLEIYVMDADGSNERKLTDNSSNDTYPTWSPDGDSIAFGSSRDGDGDVYVMDVDGGNQRPITDNDVLDGSPSWR